MTERSEHDQRMDALALRVGKVMHGERPHDVVMVCAVIIAFTMLQQMDERTFAATKINLFKLWSDLGLKFEDY